MSFKSSFQGVSYFFSTNLPEICKANMDLRE